jgi:hypothetical protein
MGDRHAPSAIEKVVSGCPPNLPSPTQDKCVWHIARVPSGGSYGLRRPELVLEDLIHHSGDRQLSDNRRPVQRDQLREKSYEVTDG